MKNKQVFIKTIVTLICVCIASISLSFTALADGSVDVSDYYLEIPLGESRNIMISASQAAGRCDLSTDGVISISDYSCWVETGAPVSITIFGNSVGSGNVYISLTDVVSEDSEQLYGDYAINVVVFEPDGGYTGDYGKSGELPEYNYDDVTQVSDVLNLWLYDEPYSVLTDLSGVEKPKGFTEADGTFEGEKVKTLNYGSEIVLYALWNHWTGDVILRTYDPATQTFGEPASFKQGNNTYYLLKIPSGTEIPEGYTKTELTLNGNKVEALLSNKEGYEDIYYIYALNDGQSGFYSYDKKEGTLQRTLELKPAQEEEQPEKAEVKKPSIFSKKIFLIALGVAAVIIIILIILLSVTRKKYKDLTEDDY